MAKVTKSVTEIQPERFRPRPNNDSRAVGFTKTASSVKDIEKQADKKCLRFIDLFCGIGGFLDTRGKYWSFKMHSDMFCLG